jgi:hypothetical protein
MFGFIADHKEVFQGLAWSILGVVAAYKAIKIATWLWVAAQSALDLALDANPIGVVIMALAGSSRAWCTPTSIRRRSGTIR